MEQVAAVTDRVVAPEPAQQKPAEGFAASFAALADVPTATLAEMLQSRAVLTGAVPSAALPQPSALGAVAPVGPAAAGGGTFVRPVEGRFSSEFGMRVHPVTGQHKMHSGVDFAAPTGTPIQAAAGGTVTFAGVQSGYGNIVIVEHPDGSETRYAHASRIDVKVGQRVAQGELIAAVGATGMATGPHLHFEIRRNGEAVDPAPLLGMDAHHDH